MFALSGEQCLFSLEETQCVKRSHRKLKPSGNESQNDARFIGFAQQSKSKCICKISQTCFITEHLFVSLSALCVTFISIILLIHLLLCVCVCVCVFTECYKGRSC